MTMPLYLCMMLAPDKQHETLSRLSTPDSMPQPKLRKSMVIWFSLHEGHGVIGDTDPGLATLYSVRPSHMDTDNSPPLRGAAANNICFVLVIRLPLCEVAHHTADGALHLLRSIGTRPSS